VVGVESLWHKVIIQRAKGMISMVGSGNDVVTVWVGPNELRMGTSTLRICQRQHRLQSHIVGPPA